MLSVFQYGCSVDVLSGHFSCLEIILCGLNMRFHQNKNTPVLQLLWVAVVVHTLTRRYTHQTNLVFPPPCAETPNCLNRPPYYMRYRTHHGPGGAGAGGV